VRVPEADRVAAPDDGELLPDHGRVLDDAPVALHDEDAEERVLEPDVDEPDVRRAVDPHRRVLGRVVRAARAAPEAAQLGARGGDADAGARPAPVARRARTADQPDRPVDDQALAVDARTDDDRVAGGGGGERGGDGAVAGRGDDDLPRRRAGRTGEERRREAERRRRGPAGAAPERDREDEAGAEEGGDRRGVEARAQLGVHLELADGVLAHELRLDAGDRQLERRVGRAAVHGARHPHLQVRHDERRHDERREHDQRAEPPPPKPRRQEEARDGAEDPHRGERPLDPRERVHRLDADVVAQDVDLADVAGDGPRPDVDDEDPLPVLRRARLHRPPREEPRGREGQHRDGDEREARGRVAAPHGGGVRGLGEGVGPCGRRRHGRQLFGSTSSHPVNSMWSAEQNSVQ